MGIPQFFRWLQKRYPNIISDRPQLPIDNLYLDLNGLVHPCFHPPERTILNEDQVFQEMFILMDKVIKAVNPQKLVYIAVDGCAPRAKLQQQRKRRFISAYEKQQKIIDLKKDLGEEALKEYLDNSMDQNCITPGTEFMVKLKKALVYYTSTRYTVNFILDDWSTPGEGEHKIMSFIRSQRSKPDYSVKTSHCIYGLDADLIMLALSSHEPNFFIFRDYINFDKQQTLCKYCAQLLNNKSQAQDVIAHIAGNCPNFKHLGQPPIANSHKFFSVNIYTFRQYLFQEFNCPANFERILDDFVFLCFLAGNDFLPHISCLKIDDGGIIRLIQVYNQSVLPTKRFITDSGFVDYQIFAVFIFELSKAENTILRKLWNEKRRYKTIMVDKKIRELSMQIEKLQLENAPQEEIDRLFVKRHKMIENPDISQEMQDYNIKFETQKLDENDTQKILLQYISVQSDVYKPDFKEKYYNRNIKNVKDACHSFLRGMSWVCHYYARGCNDWEWCYEFDFAPLVEDLIIHIKTYKHEPFNLASQPLLPYQQLLAVLPPASVQLLPAAYRNLMLDPNSPLRPFYPNRIVCDASHAHALWAAEICMPPVDIGKIISESEKCTPNLKEFEIDANKFRDPVIILMKKNEFLDTSIANLEQNQTNFFNQSCAQSYSGYYKKEAFEVVQNTFLVYRNNFKAISDFYCQKNDSGDSFYSFQPEKPVFNSKVRLSFSNCKVSPGFQLSKCYLPDSLTTGFNLSSWQSSLQKRQRDDDSIWRVQ
ncbi:5'-3' exoribonuclease 2 [Spironucleus salmonicida]|uniref:5'-3' exoribonuclease 2 n=1 Tax=Spironucleus salmonicida TaxID=348837 RepID=V6LYE0_9EUKA|nr:5'-3' exoribonuclease 2 [Spironucleus salmonicida]|eukprot:EST45824.1 5'-3' exoribonuclease 2 [Spironucleus salmonicida]